jgi:catechol 2,3-dioxygenase-like lactoylglutathione lyase family enzyme
MTDSSTVRATLLVLYCVRLEECRSFYCSLGLNFTAEQHGQGPSHYAAILADGMVFELYPASPHRESGALRLAFSVTGATATPPLAPGRHRLTDPDGRTVEVHAS